RLGTAVFSDLRVVPTAGILAPRFPCESQAPLAKALLEEVFVKTSEVPHLVNSERVQILFGNLAHTGHLAHIEGSQKLRLLPRNHPQNAVRLGLIRTDLRDQS